LIAAEEEERARIAANVHDDSVQALAAVDLRLGLLRRQILQPAPDLAAGIEEVQRTVGTVTAGLRDLLFDLEAGDTSTLLPDLLREAADHLLESSPIGYTLEVDDSRWDHASVLSASDRGQALRIFKEVLLEIRRHGRARNVMVRVGADLEGVEVSIADSGADAAPSQRWDIATLRDRAEVSGGWCRVEGGDTGRTVRFWMPFDPTAPPFMGPRH
jgi:signal transduction histidine kinase